MSMPVRVFGINRDYTQKVSSLQTIGRNLLCSNFYHQAGTVSCHTALRFRLMAPLMSHGGMFEMRPNVDHRETE
jgi:hypothetical protein